MRWHLWYVDWSLGNNRIHCSSGASLQATGLALEMHGRRRLPQSGLVHWGWERTCLAGPSLLEVGEGGCLLQEMSGKTHPFTPKPDLSFLPAQIGYGN